MGSGFLFVLILMFALMYLLLIRPQRKQQRRQQEMLDNVKVGDEVITVGGMYGDVVEVQVDRVSLEIAEDVEVEVAKRAIASVVPAEDAAAREVEEAQAEMLAESEPTGDPEPVATPEDAARR
ncbi:MAG: preprotein translocase subunit YajC [Actinobacteria bacterium]|nr:preprotein translocase subunit YajC [Actinomycetota bacterium]